MNAFVKQGKVSTFFLFLDMLMLANEKNEEDVKRRIIGVQKLWV